MVRYKHPSNTFNPSFRDSCKLPMVLAFALLISAGCANISSRTIGLAGAGQYVISGDQVFPEGVAIDPASRRVYATSTETGTIYAGSLNSRTLYVLDEGTLSSANGVEVLASGRLGVAGGRSGRLAILDAQGGVDGVFAVPGEGEPFLNDMVAVGSQLYVTDSFRPILYRLDLADAMNDEAAESGELDAWLDLRSTPVSYEEGFNLNGIVTSPDGTALIVAQTNAQRFFRIGLADKRVELIEVAPQRGGADGLFRSGDLIYAVKDGGLNVFQVSDEGARMDFKGRIEDPRFKGPTAVTVIDGRAIVTNAQLDAREGKPDLPFTLVSLELPSWATAK